jgi:pyridoxamine 5'-phosphate oxidase
MAQAIERSFATPMIRPFFPAMSCAADVMASFLAGRGHRDKMPVVEGLPPLHIVVMIRETADPLALFGEWYAEAEKSEPNDPSALALATVGPDGTPSNRMVLLKGYDAAGFVFYSNYESRKGEQLIAHPKAAMLFHWKSLRRQVRLEGPVSQVTGEEADAYFATRARGSQIGAWASDQSRPLESRFALEKKVAEFGARHLIGAVPRPPHWSGFRLQPLLIEFWQDQAFRLHDRLEYRRASASAPWSTQTLYP